MKPCSNCQCVSPKVIHYPFVVFSTWFKRFGLTCGHCEKQFSAFAFFGRPRCPFCGVRNVPTYVCYG